MVESVGNAPTSACLQGKCIACLPRPHEEFMIFDLRFGRSLWCRPTPAEFWRLGCTLVRDLSTLARSAQQIVNRKSQIVNGMVRLPGIAPGHAPWRGAILLLNHNRGN
jgi:hypothetical protein